MAAAAAAAVWVTADCKSVVLHSGLFMPLPLPHAISDWMK